MQRTGQLTRANLRDSEQLESPTSSRLGIDLPLETRAACVLIRE